MKILSSIPNELFREIDYYRIDVKLSNVVDNDFCWMMNTENLVNYAIFREIVFHQKYNFWIQSDWRKSL